jgi:hypothetical protein
MVKCAKDKLAYGQRVPSITASSALKVPKGFLQAFGCALYVGRRA